MSHAQGHKAVTRVMFEPRNPFGFESSTLTLRGNPKISSEQNKVGPQQYPRKSVHVICNQ